jgi:hypothetical protein
VYEPDKWRGFHPEAKSFWKFFEAAWQVVPAPYDFSIARFFTLRPSAGFVRGWCVARYCVLFSFSLRRNSVFDRLKEFSVEGDRVGTLLLQLQSPIHPPLADSLVPCGGAAAAASLLHQWMRMPESFTEAVRLDLDCNDDHMVSKMEFRRWARDGVLVALLASAARARAPVQTSSSDAESEQEGGAAAPTSAVTPAPKVSVGGSAPAPALSAPAIPAPPPNCPYPQWIAYKKGSSKPDAAADDKIIYMKGPAFSDQCEEHYQLWRSNLRSCQQASVAGCDDPTAKLGFFSMEIQGKQIGAIRTQRCRMSRRGHIRSQALCSCSVSRPRACGHR